MSSYAKQVAKDAAKVEKPSAAETKKAVNKITAWSMYMRRHGRTKGKLPDTKQISKGYRDLTAEQKSELVATVEAVKVVSMTTGETNAICDDGSDYVMRRWIIPQPEVERMMMQQDIANAEMAAGFTRRGS